MTLLEIILLSYLAAVLLAATIQSLIYMLSGIGRIKFVDVISAIVVIPFAWALSLTYGPCTWLLNVIKLENNPKPETWTMSIDLTEELKSQLVALGFRQESHHISVDNIPYTGFVYRPIYTARIIIAVDAIDNCLRVSYYDKSEKTKLIVSQLKALEKIHARKVAE